MKLLIGIALSLLTQSCIWTTKQDVTQAVQKYYETYQNHSDFEAFMDHYDSNAVLEDINMATKIKGINNLKEFFNWHNADLKILGKKALEVEELVIDDHKAVAKGYFTPFQWKGIKYPSMYFITILLFNDQGKIIKQTDWINYPGNLIDCTQSGDANEWIYDKK